MLSVSISYSFKHYSVVHLHYAIWIVFNVSTFAVTISRAKVFTCQFFFVENKSLSYCRWNCCKDVQLLLFTMSSCNGPKLCVHMPLWNSGHELAEICDTFPILCFVIMIVSCIGTNYSPKIEHLVGITSVSNVKRNYDTCNKCIKWSL